MIYNFEHNAMRPRNGSLINILEIGDGDDRTPSTSKSTKMAVVDGTNGINGIAIGHDTYVENNYGIAFGAFQKAATKNSISEGMWYSRTSRYGEKRRAFADHNNKNSRGWFEWYKLVAATPGQNVWTELFLHGQSGERLVLENASCLIFNIKLIGMNNNTTPDANAYHLSGAIKRGTNAASTSLVGTVIKDLWEDNATLDAQVTADTTNGSLKLEVYSDQDVDWKWAASGWVTELRY